MSYCSIYTAMIRRSIDRDVTVPVVRFGKLGQNSITLINSAELFEADNNVKFYNVRSMS